MRIEKISDQQMPTAFDRFAAEYKAMGTPFHIAPHSYYSTGAFPFQVDSTYTDPNGFTRVLLKCAAQTAIVFFSTGIAEPADGMGLPTAPFKNTDAETNLATGLQTNDEDFAVEGLAATARGVRIQYPAGDATHAGISSLPATVTAAAKAMLAGGAVLTDPASTFLPPEVSSPLMLQTQLWQALRGKVSFQTFFDRKAGDHICRLSQVPEGGANSYLEANGEPTIHNYFRLPEGYTWRKSSGTRDRLFSLIARVEQDVWVAVTQPPLNNAAPTPANQIGLFQTLWLEWTVFALGRAFYLPSENQ